MYVSTSNTIVTVFVVTFAISFGVSRQTNIVRCFQTCLKILSYGVHLGQSSVDCRLTQNIWLLDSLSVFV
jgi:hypothetical protein